MISRYLWTCLFGLCLWTTAWAKPDGINLEGYTYPFPVHFHHFDGFEGPLRMAVMVVKPTATPNGESAVLLHGKNFNGAYWETTAKFLAAHGYTVIIPDQIGFGKSSKPTEYSYTFAQLISNTRKVVAALGAEKVTVIGHSMGGMMAMHWGLSHPQEIERLVLVNPIGLEDWTEKGVPYRGLAGWYGRELQASPESIENYQRTFYYDGQWNADYARWADLLAAPIDSPDYSRLAKVQAMTTAMIVSQPVVRKLHTLAVPTNLILGERDRTALDKDLAPPDVAKGLGRYDLLGSEIVQRLRQGRLFPLENLGHLPHIEDFPRFKKALAEALGIKEVVP